MSGDEALDPLSGAQVYGGRHEIKFPTPRVHASALCCRLLGKTLGYSTASVARVSCRLNWVPGCGVHVGIFTVSHTQPHDDCNHSFPPSATVHASPRGSSPNDRGKVKADRFSRRPRVRYRVLPQFSTGGGPMISVQLSEGVSAWFIPSACGPCQPEVPTRPGGCERMGDKYNTPAVAFTSRGLHQLCAKRLRDGLTYSDIQRALSSPMHSSRLDFVHNDAGLAVAVLLS